MLIFYPAPYWTGVNLVLVAPVVKLILGGNLISNDIKIGNDVYFECHVRSNPPTQTISWAKNVSKCIINFNC